jgi:hypothetical protein
MVDDGADEPPGDEIALPIDGTLDLHTFDPREVGELVPDYLAACRERGILEVRIVHGKGGGTLRRRVHALLERLPEVAAFRLADEHGGGWGATLVTLRPEAGGPPAARHDRRVSPTVSEIQPSLTLRLPPEYSALGQHGSLVHSLQGWTLWS